MVSVALVRNCTDFSGLWDQPIKTDSNATAAVGLALFSHVIFYAVETRFN
jgi:hypothetical protein